VAARVGKQDPFGGGELRYRRAGVGDEPRLDALGDPAGATNELAGWSLGTFEQLVLDVLSIPATLTKDSAGLGPDDEDGVACEPQSPVRDRLESFGEAPA